MGVPKSLTWRCKKQTVAVYLYRYAPMYLSDVMLVVVSDTDISVRTCIAVMSMINNPNIITGGRPL